MIAEIKSLFFSVCVVLIMSALLGLPDALAQEDPPTIGKKVEREELLELSAHLLESGNSTFYERNLDLHSPYLVYIEKRVVVGPEGAVVAVSNELPDLSVLNIVAGRMKPKGSLIKGGKHVLLLEKSGKLTLGSVIPVTIRKVTYKVIISDISDKTFTIKLNEAERIVSIRSNISRGKITFDRP